MLGVLSSPGVAILIAHKKPYANASTLKRVVDLAKDPEQHRSDIAHVFVMVPGMCGWLAMGRGIENGGAGIFSKIHYGVGCNVTT
jgi:hypothetical protein